MFFRTKSWHFCYQLNFLFGHNIQYMVFVSNSVFVGKKIGFSFQSDHLCMCFQVQTIKYGFLSIPANFQKLFNLKGRDLRPVVC